MNHRLPIRPLLTGAIYLALHAASLVLYAPMEGLGGAAPWFAAGLGLALLLRCGITYAPLMAFAMVAGALFSLPSELGLQRVIWPLSATALLALTAYACRRVLGDRYQVSRVRELGLCAGILLVASILTAGMALYVSSCIANPASHGLSSSFTSLFLCHFVALIGFGLPLFSALGCILGPVDLPQARKLELGMLELMIQAALLSSCIAASLLRPSLWLANIAVLAPLLWIAIRLGLSGAAPSVLLVVAGRWAFLNESALAGIDIQTILLQDLVVCGIGLVIGSVISARERYQASLHARYQAVERVLRGAQMGFWEWDGGARLSLDKQWLALMGYDVEAFDGADSSWRKWVHPEDLSHVLWLRDAHWKGHAPSFEAEYRVCGVDGSYRWVLDRGTVVERSLTGAPVRMAGACLDISERKSMDLQQRTIVEILDSAADFIGAADINGNMVYANLALMRLCNDTDLASVRRRHLSEYFPEEVARRILLEGMPTAMAQGFWWIETTLGASSGNEIKVSLKIVVYRDADGAPRYISMIARDVSLPMRVAEELRETAVREQMNRKYESLGVLAGGVAHDINNLLTAMLGNASLARADLPDDASAQVYFHQVEQAALRAADLCQLLHTYSGKGRANSQPGELNACLRSLEPALISLCEGRHRLTLALCDGELPMQLDEALLKRAMRALVRNACEACPPREGEITIRTGIFAVDAETFKTPCYSPEIPSGEYAFVEVCDNGSGMNARVRERLFEPFYSTRPGHAGLGLAKVISAVRAHSGAVVIGPESVKGCTVRLLLPLGNASEGKPSVEAAVPANWRSAGQVLVIDDEEAVRTVATFMLESMGFTPLVAASGQEGLRVFRQHAGFLKAVLLDLSMPLMDGERVYSEMRRIDAEVPVVIMSGYTEKEIESRFKDKELAGFLHKPFTMQFLRALMFRVIRAGN